MTASNYSWLKVIEPEIAHLQNLSAVGGPSEFSWEELSSQFTEQFDIPMKIEQGASNWHTSEEVDLLFKRSSLLLHFTLSGLPGQATWLVSKREVAVLMSALLLRQSDPLDYHDEEFQKGFFHFLAVAVTNKLASLGLKGDLGLSTVDTQAYQGNSLSLEVTVHLLETTIVTHLLASEELVKRWKERFASSKRVSPIPSVAAQNLDMEICFEAGKVTLPFKELQKARLGDFLILDTCTIVPGEDKGRITMTLNGTPIFRGKRKSNKIKVLEYPIYYSVEAPMSKDEELFEEEEELEDQPSHLENQESDLEDQESDLEDQVEETHSEVEKSGDASFIERAKDVPITVTIEVGRMQMKLEKLMQMQPGDLLELEVDPEERVNLIMNGRCIGHGELLKLGETLGVRILEIG